MASSSECAPRPDAGSSHAAAARDASVSPHEAPLPLVSSFPRTCRLTSRRQYLSVYAKGDRVGSTSLVLFGLPNGLDHSRVGITVTRKVGGAVRRNRVKRTLREVFRMHRHQLRPPMDLVVNARTTIVSSSFAALETEFLQSFRRLARRCAS